MVIADAVFRNHHVRALEMLREICATEAPISSGSFDIIVQAAARARDRKTAVRTYRLMRRTKVAPTAHTLNSLMNVYARCDDPKAAVALLSRAQAGLPRWPGARPDAWSWSTAMACAAKAGEYRLVRELFARLRATRGIVPNKVAYNVAIDSCFKLGKPATSQVKRVRA